MKKKLLIISLMVLSILLFTSCDGNKQSKNKEITEEKVGKVIEDVQKQKKDEILENFKEKTVTDAVTQNNIDAQQAVTSDTFNRDKAYGWGFRKILGSAPELPQETVEIVKKYGGYYLGDTSKKVLYLTFDQGYENGYTAKILDILKKEKVPACFFLTGPYIKTESALVQRMVAEGHVLGNHTVHHPSLPQISNEQIEKEISELSDLYYDLTGNTMKYLRPPKGEYSIRSLEVTQKMGYKTIFWSSAYADWDINKQNGKENAIKKVTQQFHNGSIILLHSVSKDNMEALEDIIRIAREQGYTFETLDNL